MEFIGKPMAFESMQGGNYVHVTFESEKDAEYARAVLLLAGHSPASLGLTAVEEKSLLQQARSKELYAHDITAQELVPLIHNAEAVFAALSARGRAIHESLTVMPIPEIRFSTTEMARSGNGTEVIFDIPHSNFAKDPHRTLANELTRAGIEADSKTLRGEKLFLSIRPIGENQLAMLREHLNVPKPAVSSDGPERFINTKPGRGRE